MGQLEITYNLFQINNPLSWNILCEEELKLEFFRGELGYWKKHIATNFFHFYSSIIWFCLLDSRNDEIILNIGGFLEGGFFFLKEERAVKKWYFCQIFRHKCRKELKSKTFRNTPPSPSSTQNGAVNPPLIWVFCKREIEQQTNFHFMGSFVLFIISSILSYRFYYKQNKKKKLIDWTKENLRVFLNLRVVK